MTRLLDSTPREDGYRMPGEYEPHAGTWLLWPQRPDVWRLGGKPAQRAFVALATAIARFEFPAREVVPLSSREIILAGGNVHCVTQQQPLGERR